MSRSLDFLSFTSSSGASSSLPARRSFLVTDSVACPATFLLTLLISQALRPSSITARQGSEGVNLWNNHNSKKKRKVVLVGVKESQADYVHLLKKQGIQLATERTTDAFEFVDGSHGDLSKTFSTLRSSLVAAGARDEAEHAGPLVVIDDVSTLSWIGNDVERVARFVLAIQTIVRTANATLVSVLHSDSLEPCPSISDRSDQWLFRKLLQGSDWWIELKNLDSQSRGELSIHSAPSLLPPPLSSDALDPRSGKTALQYRVEETGAEFEVKGVGKFL
ncbi:hypothetical protein JCM10212_002361 [Sporobolomyces blumeae]